MARLVAVCRNGEDGFPFKKRQIPLAIDDTLTLVMEFPDTLLNAEGGQVNSAQLKQFTQHYEMLSGQELVCAVRVPPRELVGCLPEQVACVGCRGSVERLFSALLESGTPALEPLLLESSGELVVCHSYLADARKLYCLFYLHGAKLNDILDSIPKSKKNRRCPFHSLDTHKAKPLGGSWTDVWDRMSQDCRDEVVLIDSDCLLETLETHLRKHRFCGECKTKVLRAYAILTGEVDGSKEKGYCAGLYEGLRSCPHERHVHVSCDTTFISHLLGRAVSELAGGRRERHAKTLDSAQEEVVTCLAIHLYERLHRIWQRLRAEEQTWQLLFHLGVDALRKSFEVAVERKQGVSRIDMLCEELWEEERARELRQEKKRQKRRNRRKNKFGLDGADASTDLAEPVQEDADGSDDGDGMSDAIPALPAASTSPAPLASEVGDGACMCLFATDGPQATNGHVLADHRSTEATLQGTFKVNGSSDCGYSSSAEGSEPGSQDGSEGSGQGDAADPRKDFAGWLKSQGMSGRIAAAIDKELGISNYDILLACSEDAEVKADLLKAAKEKMPFAFYAVLRRVVEKISPTPSQSPPPQSSPQQQPLSGAGRSPVLCSSVPAAPSSSSSAVQGKGSLFFPPPSLGPALGPALGLFSASKVPVVGGATFPLPRVAAAAQASASGAGKPVDGALKTLGFSSLLQSAQKLRELEKVLLDATQPKAGGDAGGGAGASAGNGVRQDKSIAELLQSALNLSELADGREARATVSTDAAGFTSLKQNKELTELIESAKRLSNMYISEAGKEKAEAAKGARHQDGSVSASSGLASVLSEAPKSGKAAVNGLKPDQRLANLVQAVQKSSAAFGGGQDGGKERKGATADSRTPLMQHSTASETGCRVDGGGGGGVEKAPAGCCPECTAKSALPLAAETLPDGGKKKKKKKKNQGQQADEPDDVGAATVCAQLKLGVCVRCDGCGAVGHRPPDKGIPLLAAAIAQQPELKKAQAAQTEIKQPAQKQADAKQGAKKQVEAKQQPLAKQPDAKHKQPDAKQPAQRQPEAKQPGQRPPDGKQPAQKQPDGKQAAQKQQEVKQPPQKQPDGKQPAQKHLDGKQPAQKQEIKQPAHKQPDVKQGSQKQQDAKQPLQKQQDGKQAAVQKSNGVQKANDQRVAQQGTRAQQQKVQQQQLKKGGQKRGGKQPTGGEEKQDPARSLADMLRDAADDADDVTKRCPSSPPVQRRTWEEDDSDDCFPDAESFISPDEIRSFKASHRAFYVQRDQYRQQLQERFNQYCNAHNGPCDQRCCNGKWLATAGVK
ncbi:gametogenetin-binding protein 2 isoform X1 [Petromyzon marinus]|uniref:gametogenetin-binding protein 2 isoform X1 n=1 Tax=Petromyzon marinus TaxID=7757 RepID=UPI003F71CF44